MNNPAISSSFSEDAGKFVLRATLAVLILFHGIFKLQHGIDFISGMVTEAGAPPIVANLVYIGEVIAPLLVLVGLFTRPAALIIVINMLVAFALVHKNELLSISNMGGWALELQGFYLFTAVAVSLLGAGRFSLDYKSRHKI